MNTPDEAFASIINKSMLRNWAKEIAQSRIRKKRQVRHNTSRRSATCSVPLRSVPLRFAPFRIVLLHYALIIYAPRSVPLRSALLCSSTYAPYYKEPACFHNYQHAGFCPIRAVSFHAVMKKNDFFITETTFSVALGPFVLGANISLSSVCWFGSYRSVTFTKKNRF